MIINDICFHMSFTKSIIALRGKIKILGERQNLVTRYFFNSCSTFIQHSFKIIMGSVFLNLNHIYIYIYIYSNVDFFFFFFLKGLLKLEIN
jgi:hypothetical protein